MENIARIYLDFLYNMFLLLFLLRLVRQQLQKKINGKLIFFLVLIQLVYAIPAYIPYSNLCALLLDFLSVLLLCYPKNKQIILIFIKYEFASNFIFGIIYLLHSLLLWDFRNFVYNKYYFQCKNLICISLIYIFYVLYTNSKRIKVFHTHFQHYFNCIIILTSIVLSYITLYFCKTSPSISFVMPVLFSFIYILIIACILIYEKFIDLLSENAKTRIQLEKIQLEQQYSVQIAANLKSLSAIRHDMKNHLIVIHGYAMQNDCSKISGYIQKISDNFLPTDFIQTPSETVSALLSAKSQKARNMHITCTFACNFPSIHIDDYYLITILGNLLDNSISASAKLSDGTVRLKMLQIESYLEIIVENNHCEQVRESHGNFLSTKKDANAFHGIGIQNVRSAVAALNGQIDIIYTSHEFHVTVLVPNY